MMSLRWKKFLFTAFLAALFPALSGCAAAVGAGATAAAAAAQERGLGGAIDDVAIHAVITKNWLEHDASLFVDVDIEVHEGRVLLTGAVKTPQEHLKAVRLAWQAKGVRQVIDEIQVTDTFSVVDYARDSWISIQLRTKIALDMDILSINYSIETVNGIVYLMGIAQNQKEIDRVIRYARNIKNVNNVISHMRIKGHRLPAS